jgi:LPS sulfotransferase NodH
MEANKFIILTTQRTGSTYLRLWLNNHPEIIVHGEILMPESRKKNGFPNYLLQKPIKYQLYKNCFLKKILNKFNVVRILYNKIFHKNIYTYINGLFYNQNLLNTGNSQKPDIKAIGLKLMYNQVNNFKIIKEWISINKPKIIFLERADKIAQCNSKYTAKINKLHHTDKEIELTSYKANKRFFKKCLKRQKKIENKINLFLNQSNLEILHIYYEDFVGLNRNSTKKEILAFLSANQVIDPDVNLKKINKKPIKTLIKNYEEINKIYQNIYKKKYIID